MTSSLGTAPPAVAVAVEGDTDIAVVRKLFDEAGIGISYSHVCGGLPKLRKQLRGFNQAARHQPWFVLCDLDNAPCAPGRRAEMFQTRCPEASLHFRIAKRAVEAWLLADRVAFAQFLGVSSERLPRYPEDEQNPKETVVNLARKSRKQPIREGMVPRQGSGRRVGPAYAIQISEFAGELWSPDRASACADSLARALARCRHFRKTGTWR